MRIIVMGVGPVGGIIGGRLAKASNDVLLVDVNSEHVRAIREQGLKVNVPDGSFILKTPVLFPEEIRGKFDLAFIAVRSYQTEQVLTTLKPHLAPGAILVSLQNGINTPILVEQAGHAHAIGTVVRMGCRLVAPGHVHTDIRGQLFIGHPRGHTTSQLTSVHALLNSVIPTDITNNIIGFLWSKLTYTCLGMFGSLAEVSLKEIWENEKNQNLAVKLLAEILKVGISAGIHFEPLKEYHPSDFHPSRPEKVRHSVFAEVAANWKSNKPCGPVRQLKSGRKTEVDYTTGHVVREGERLNIPTPICRAVLKMIHEIEEGKRSLQLENYKELAEKVSL